MVSRGFIEDVRDRVKIEDVVGEHVELKRSGASMKGLCPFHEEKTPSFHVHPERGFFYCFGCHVGGDVIKFVQMISGRSFMESVRDLASRAGIEVPREEFSRSAETDHEDARRERHLAVLEGAARLYEKVLAQHPDAAPAREYLERRAIDTACAARFRLGYAPDRWDFMVEHMRSRRLSPEDGVAVGLLRPRRQSDGYYDWFRRRIMFPVMNPAGKVIGFSGRIVPGGEGTGGEEAKYLNGPETSTYRKGETVYGLSLAATAIRRTGRIYLVEGNFDLVSMSQAGFENVVAPMGTALTQAQVARLGRFGAELVFVFDGDAAGRAAALRSFEVVAPAGLTARVATLPAGEDPDSLVRKKGAEALREVLGAAEEMGRFVIRHAAQEAGDSISRKVEAARHLWKTLGRVPDPMLRDLYLKQMAGDFRIDEATLRRHVGSVATATAGGRPAVAGQEATSPDAAPEALELVGALLDDPQLAGRRGREIEELVLGNEGLDGLLRMLLASPPGEVVDRLRETLTTPDAGPYKRWALERLVRPVYTTPEQAEEALNDCLRRIEGRALESRSREIDREMLEAVRAGDTARRDALLKEKTQLRRRTAQG